MALSGMEEHCWGTFSLKKLHVVIEKRRKRRHVETTSSLYNTFCVVMRSFQDGGSSVGRPLLLLTLLSVEQWKPSDTLALCEYTSSKRYFILNLFIPWLLKDLLLDVFENNINHIGGALLAQKCPWTHWNGTSNLCYRTQHVSWTNHKEDGTNLNQWEKKEGRNVPCHDKARGVQGNQPISKLLS